MDYIARSIANFTDGEGPIEYDIEGQLGRKGTQGFFHNYGTGSCTIAISTDGENYGDDILFVAGDTIGFGGGDREMDAVLPISKILVTDIDPT